MAALRHRPISVVRRLWIAIGRAAYWIGWPGIYIILRTQPPRTRVVVVVDSHILMIRDWLGPGSWTLPGGGLYQQESSATGACRELFEETGISLRPKDLQSLGQYKVRSHGIPVSIAAYYVQLHKRPKIRLRLFEVLDYQWVHLSEITHLQLSQTAHWPLRTYLNRSPNDH